LSKRKVYLVNYSDDFGTTKIIISAKDKQKIIEKFNGCYHISIKELEHVYASKKICYFVSNGGH